MSVAVSPPVAGTGAPAGGPPAKVAAPREAVIEDRGTSRRDSVRARRWTVRGTVKVAGEVDVEEGDVTGLVSVGRALTANQLRIRGSIESEGPVRVRGRLSIRGDGHFGAALGAVDLDLEGCVRAVTAVTVERTLTSHGVLEAPSLSVGVLRVEGSLTVPGEIRALEVDARFSQPSVLGNVRSPAVRLRGHLPNLLDKILVRENWTRVERIEAERVELEAVDVGFVRAKEIVLGRQSHVTEVDGTVVSRHASAWIGPESRTPLPYGLRR